MLEDFLVRNWKANSFRLNLRIRARKPVPHRANGSLRDVPFGC